METYNVVKTYHFYAAHRNEELCDKCLNLHGHTYYITCWFDLPLSDKGNITVLFGDIDAKVEPIIKGEYDHGMIIHDKDPLYECLQNFCKEQGTTFKFKVLPYPTSVENVAKTLYHEIKEKTGLNIVKLAIKETTSSTIEYEE